ncbi:hypothetical protein, partial [Streptomyces sp. AC154]|uniref:hypothetical protein n=1 Tax=Streptomyces sp. AC154 TaxID=3143184 RepID=UPI003F7D85E0
MASRSCPARSARAARAALTDGRTGTDPVVRAGCPGRDGWGGSSGLDDCVRGPGAAPGRFAGAGAGRAGG